MPDAYNYWEDPGAREADHIYQDQMNFWKSRKWGPKWGRQESRRLGKDPMGTILGIAGKTAIANSRAVAAQQAYDPGVAATDPALQGMRTAVMQNRARSSLYPAILQGIAGEQSDLMGMAQQGYQTKNQGISGTYGAMANNRRGAYNRTQRQSWLDKLQQYSSLASNVMGTVGGIPGLG